jgi:hypothetical protein
MIILLIIDIFTPRTRGGEKRTIDRSPKRSAGIETLAGSVPAEPNLNCQVEPLFKSAALTTV